MNIAEREDLHDEIQSSTSTVTRSMRTVARSTSTVALSTSTIFLTNDLYLPAYLLTGRRFQVHHLVIVGQRCDLVFRGPVIPQPRQPFDNLGVAGGDVVELRTLH